MRDCREMLKEPTFARQSEMTRYVPVVQRLKGNRPSSVAFKANPGEDYLSVNSLEVETLQSILIYYKKEIRENCEEVAYCRHKVADYNKGAKSARVDISFNRISSCWEYAGPEGQEPAYKHRPVSPRAYRLGSRSHCGVEFIKIFDAIAEKRFAKRMARRKFFCRQV